MERILDNLGGHWNRRAALVLAGFAAVSSAHAQAAQVPIQLVWQAEGRARECMQESELRSRIETQLGTSPFAPDGTRIITVRAGNTSEGLAAEVELLDEQRHSLGSRYLSVPGFDCPTLMDAVVFAVVMAIDPDGSSASRRESAATTQEIVIDRRAPAASGIVVLKRAEVLPIAPPLKREGIVVIGRALLTHGLVPGIQAGIEVGLDAPLSTGWGVQALAMTTAPGDFSGPDGHRVDVTLLAASLLARRQWWLSKRWLMEAGLGMTGGGFHTTVHGAPAEGPSWYPDWAVRGGLGVGLRVRPWLGLQASAAGSFSLHRQQFSTATASWSQPFFGVTAALGITLHPRAQ